MYQLSAVKLALLSAISGVANQSLTFVTLGARGVAGDQFAEEFIVAERRQIGDALLRSEKFFLGRQKAIIHVRTITLGVSPGYCVWTPLVLFSRYLSPNWKTIAEPSFRVMV